MCTSGLFYIEKVRHMPDRKSFSFLPIIDQGLDGLYGGIKDPQNKKEFYYMHVIHPFSCFSIMGMSYRTMPEYH